MTTAPLPDKQNEGGIDPRKERSPPTATNKEPYSIFDRRQKALIVLIVSFAATCKFRRAVGQDTRADTDLVSGISSNIYFPAIPAISTDLHVSTELVNLTVTSYLIFQGIAPSLWGTISDVKGRRIAYISTFTIYLAACIGLAASKSYAALIVLRCLQSTGSASTIAIGAGVIGDITTRADRGGYIGIFQAGFSVSLPVGPVIGGAIAGSLGWRAIFWFLTIYSAVFLLVLALILPETLRSVVANGSRAPTNFIAKYPLRWYQKTTKVECSPVEASQGPPIVKKFDITGPLRILFSKRAAPIILFFATYYAVWQMSITAMSSLFASEYGLGETSIGLTFIANGVGSMIGTLVIGKVLDVEYRRVKATHHRGISAAEGSTDSSPSSAAAEDDNDAEDDFPLEKARLRLMPIFAICQCLAIIVFGWTIQFPHKVSIAVPIASTFVTGWTAVSTQSVVTTYLVDVFPTQGASSSASLNLARCLFAAAGNSFIIPLIQSVGVGPAFTICAAAQFLALGGLVVQRKYGAAWRVDAEAVKSVEKRAKTMGM